MWWASPEGERRGEAGEGRRRERGLRVGGRAAGRSFPLGEAGIRAGAGSLSAAASQV